ncbi:IclR family transcriptional regulator [Terasakiella pusilla]|uniref:IclR family transcriptional regulator n=1 Tax=Terasakiella pusilla TaxID=64973 RepID=UPI003AA81F3C
MDYKSDRRFAQTLARGLQVLKAFRSDDGPLGNQELSERTGIPKSTISRLTYTLSVLGYLEHLESYEKYRLGAAAISLGSIANKTIPFMDTAADMMQSLAEEVGAFVGLTMRDADKMLITHCWRPVNAASVWLNVGFKLPLFTTSSGLAYLGAVRPANVEALVENYGDSAGISREEIMKSVEASRFQIENYGFYSSAGSWTSDINSAAVPLRSPSFSEPVTFVCGAPAAMIDMDRFNTEIGPKLVSRIKKIEVL